MFLIYVHNGSALFISCEKNIYAFVTNNCFTENCIYTPKEVTLAMSILVPSSAGSK